MSRDKPSNALLQIRLVIIYGLISSMLGLSSCELVAPKKRGFVQIDCSAEVVIKEKEKGQLLSADSLVKIQGAAYRDSEHMRSGGFSLKSDSVREYLYTLSIDDVKVDDRYYYSAWYYGALDKPPALVIDGPGFYFISDEVIEERDGWYKIGLQAYIPPTIEESQLKCYVWNRKRSTIWVDDVRFERKESFPDYPFGMQPLRMHIDEREMEKIEALRIEALREGVLVTTDDSWVKAILFDGEDLLKSEVRLKGDWTDHLEGRKWSFRVKLKKDHTFRNKRVFSLQTPKARSFLSEWLLHQICEGEDILTTTYDFVPLVINQVPVGMYAYEEHFVKQLVESRNRREGPILKLGEDHFWELMRFEEKQSFPTFAASEILPFGSGKIVSDSALYQRFLAAQSAVQRMRGTTTDAVAAVNKEKMGKYIALIDVFKTFHGAAWHNVRFYYDPISAQIEPIGYDLYGDFGIPEKYERSVFLDNYRPGETEINGLSLIATQLADPEIYSVYTRHLERMTRPEYLDSVMERLGPEIDELERLLQMEFVDYSFDVEQLRRSARSTRERLMSGDLPEPLPLTNTPTDISKQYSPAGFNPEIAGHWLNAYRQTEHIVRVENFYTDSIVIVGYTDAQGETYSLKELRLAAYGQLTAPTAEVELPGTAKTIIFRPPSAEEMTEAEILPWPSPSTYRRTELPRIALHPSIDTTSMPWVMSGRDIRIDGPLVIPTGVELVIEAGTEIDLVNGGFLFSYSPMQIRGETARPVLIGSSDATGLGLSILDAQGMSTIEHCHFSDQNDFHFDRWSLSGSVNVYRSPIEISDSRFERNLCEDALNIIRSRFVVNRCHFADIYGDAFDSDFSQGVLKGSTFERVGNDGIDFSGSQVEVVDCHFSEIGDKAVSGGEASHLIVRDSNIDGANIAVASKDRSIVELDKVVMRNSRYGLLTFQKKPEYDAASILTQDVSLEDIDIPTLIEKRSYITFESDTLKGTEKNVADRFY